MVREAAEVRSLSHMTSAEFRRLIVEGDHGTQQDVADILGVHRLTIGRWLNERLPISKAYAALIRERLGKPTRKQK